MSNKYILILLLFLIWMLFFDANNWFFHKELNNDIKSLEKNEAFYENEITDDKAFLKKMEDPNEVEKFAREKYYLKKENEAIFIIQKDSAE